MEITNESALAIASHAIAQYKVMHSAANIDWINLDETKVSKGSCNIWRRSIQQDSAAMKSPRIQR
jgi:hypothetical protein